MIKHKEFMSTLLDGAEDKYQRMEARLDMKDPSFTTFMFNILNNFREGGIGDDN